MLGIECPVIDILPTAGGQCEQATGSQTPLFASIRDWRTTTMNIQKIQWTPYTPAGEAPKPPQAGRLISVLSETVEVGSNGRPRNVTTAYVVGIDANGGLFSTPKNLAFLHPRLSTIEGLDVLDGAPISAETLIEKVMEQQAARTGARASDGASVSLAELA